MYVNHRGNNQEVNPGGQEDQCSDEIVREILCAGGPAQWLLKAKQNTFDNRHVDSRARRSAKNDVHSKVQQNKRSIKR
jgi:hypothetical protein